MKRPCLPLPAVQAATTKILSTKCLNIAEPRIFCPPKIPVTRYYTAEAIKYMYSVKEASELQIIMCTSDMFHIKLQFRYGQTEDTQLHVTTSPSEENPQLFE